MPLNIQSTDNMAAKKLNVLLYGPPGAGKTRFIGSAASQFKTIIASAESGLLSIRGVKADFVDIKSWEDLEELTRFLMGSTHDYQCFAIDSGTEIQQVCMDSILARTGKEKPELQDWGVLNNKMVRMVRYFRDMGQMNMIMTALSESLPEPDGSVKNHPMFQGRFQKAVAGYFDVVAYGFVHQTGLGTPDEKKQHLMVCHSSDKLVTKDRTDSLPKVIPNDFPTMYNLVFNKQQEQK